MENYKKAVFYDRFVNKLHKWEEDVFSFYYKDSYHLYPRGFFSEFTWVSLNKAHSFRNFTYEVEARWIEGRTDIGYGLAFRSNSKDDTYVFTITKNGFYSMGMLKKGNYKLLSNLENGSSVINENKSNKISVKCLGNEITAYVNGNKVLTLEDYTYESGCFGFFSGANVHTCYNNVKITEIERG